MFKRILIVDDSVSARMIIRQYLQIVGCAEAEFIEASNGRKALDALKGQEVSLIVTDMNMPEMDGAQFIRRLKASPKFNSIPIIIISSAAKKENEERFLEFGANFIISKPISPQVLHRAIASLESAS